MSVVDLSCIRDIVLIYKFFLFFFFVFCFLCFFQAEDGIRDLVRSRGLGDVYKRQVERRLVEVEDATGRITYFAVTDKTEDNMLISESGLSHSHDPLLRCKMRLLGNVLVEQPINNLSLIHI